MLSEHKIKIADWYNVAIGKTKNFAPNLVDKEKYVIHYENSQLYLNFTLLYLTRIGV